jgi:hypothetical protein
MGREALGLHQGQPSRPLDSPELVNHPHVPVMNFDLINGEAAALFGMPLWSMFFAVIGAVFFLVASHLMRKVVD